MPLFIYLFQSCLLVIIVIIIRNNGDVKSKHHKSLNAMFNFKNQRSLYKVCVCVCGGGGGVAF